MTLWLDPLRINLTAIAQPRSIVTTIGQSDLQSFAAFAAPPKNWDPFLAPNALDLRIPISSV